MKKQVCYFNLAILGVAIFLTLSIPAPAARAGQADPGDLWIKSAMESVMQKDGRLNLNRLKVRSQNGIVKLGGTAMTDDEKGLAELIAMEIPGVKGIENDIEVLPPVDPDSELQKETRVELIDNPLFHIHDLNVRARNGVVTLRGLVQRNQEKHLARRLVARLPHVHRVVNKIEALERA